MKKLILLLGCFFCISAFAEQIPAEVLEKTLAQIHTLQADFSETISSGPEINQKLSGLFMLKKPGKFYWQTLKPIHQDIISNGKKVWVYDKDLEQIMVKSLEENVGATPALLLNGKPGSISKHYAVVMRSKDIKTNDSPPKRVFILIPKEKMLYNYVQISFDGNILTHMRFEDALGQLTDFYFTQVKINSKLSDEAFIFTPPKGVDIVYG